MNIRSASNNKWKKSAILMAALVCTGGAVFGQTTTTTNITFTVGKQIPDGNPSGLADTHTLNFSTIPNFTSIVDLTVTLNISGGYNGDYYAYLANNHGGFTVLLNRVGKTVLNPAGYSDSGFTSVTLSSSSANNIHTYQSVSNPNGGALTGTFAPDGRNIDPSLVLDTTPSTATLASFIGEDPSATWTLFLADVDFGEQGTLASWTLTVTAVPEPSSIALGVLGLGVCFGLRRFVRRSA